MKMEIIKGQYSLADAKELLSEMVHVKIRFHERKIAHSSNEEDIKCRENRIKELQRDLFAVKSGLSNHLDSVTLDAVLQLNQS